MRTRFDIEEIQASKTEKFLAVVLAAFCLLGGVWAYQKIDDKVADHVQPGRTSERRRRCGDQSP